MSTPHQAEGCRGRIAEVIGTARENFARSFADFKKEQLLVVHCVIVVIHSRFELERMAPSWFGRS